MTTSRITMTAPSNHRLHLALVLFACACSPGTQAGTKTGNGISLEFGTAQQALSLAEESDGGSSASTASALTRDAQGTNYRITEATMAVTEIEVRSLDALGCDQLPTDSSVDCTDGDLRIRGEFEVDLLARTTSPSLDPYLLPAGDYERLDVEISPLGDGSPLEDITFRVQGVMAPGDLDIPFLLELKRTENLRFESSGTLSIPEEGKLLAHFNPAQWFTQLPITTCLDDGDLETTNGILHIDEDSDCGEVEAAFVEALRSSTELEQQ